MSRPLRSRCVQRWPFNRELRVVRYNRGDDAQKGKKLVKQNGIAHHAALDIVARAGGWFTDWHHLIEAAKATEPTEREFKAGLIIGMDP